MAFQNGTIVKIDVQVTNLHIRYEDTVTRPGHPFACGTTLHSVGAFTVDDAGHEMFVKKAAMALLRKASQLSRFAIYFDTGRSSKVPGIMLRHSVAAMSPFHNSLHVAADVECLLYEEHHIHQWSTADWDKHFNPGIAVDADVEGRQYVLNPVDGDATYVRRATEVVDSQSTPYQDIIMNWPEFALRLSHGQALNVTLLLQELSRHQVCQTARPRCHCGPVSHGLHSSDAWNLMEYSMIACECLL